MCPVSYEFPDGTIDIFLIKDTRSKHDVFRLLTLYQPVLQMLYFAS